MKSKGSFYIPATRPWFSPDAGEKIERWGMDEQEKIDFCLEHCPYADSDCVNCMGSTKKKSSRAANRPSKYDPDVLRELLKLKKTDQEICDVLGVTSRTVRNYKKKLATSIPA